MNRIIRFAHSLLRDFSRSRCSRLRRSPSSGPRSAIRAMRPTRRRAPCYGAVGYNYNIGTYDVTNSQYVEFLNAKDPTATSPLQLYNSNMSNATYGGITYNSGAASGSKYSVMSGDGNHPVNYVTWFDTLRFANWLNNGQGNGDTESGAYTPARRHAHADATPTRITRNAGATVFLPSENEWYKAAYYDPATQGSRTSSTGVRPAATRLPTASGPTATPNSANYNNVVGNLTDVGAYTRHDEPLRRVRHGGQRLSMERSLDQRFVSGLAGWFVRQHSDNLQSSNRDFVYPTDENSDCRIPRGTCP